MCWSDIDKAGVFESSRCEKIGNHLISEINSVLKPQTSDNENLADSSQAVQQTQPIIPLPEECVFVPMADKLGIDINLAAKLYDAIVERYNRRVL